MTGPHVRRIVGATHLSFSVAGISILIGILWVVLSQESDAATHSATVALLAVVVAALYLAVSYLLDRSLAGLSGLAPSVGPTHFSMSGAISVRRDTDDWIAHRYVIRAYVLYAVFGVVFLALAGSASQGGSVWNDLLFPLAVMLGVSCLMRLCAIRGFPGGVAASWYLSILGDDEDAVETTARVISYGTGLLMAFSGFLILAQPGPWSAWGLVGVALGLESMALTQWFNRRERWMSAAAERPLAEIGHSRLPTISHAAPISELLSIFAVEGNQAMVVVVDESGQPSGLIQLRQLRAAVHSGGRAHPDEVMVTLSRVPHLPRETTVFDAALFLERTGQLALVTEGPSGKLRVVSLEELFRIID